jgi:hypothetical protein
MTDPPFLLGALLLAEASGASPWAVPTWTDHEVLLTLGCTLAGLILVVLVIVRFAVARLRENLRQAKLEIDRLRAELDGKTPNTELEAIIRHLCEEARAAATCQPRQTDAPRAAEESVGEDENA